MTVATTPGRRRPVSTGALRDDGPLGAPAEPGAPGAPSSGAFRGLVALRGRLRAHRRTGGGHLVLGKHVARGLDDDVPADQVAEDRPGEDDGGDRDQQAEGQGRAQVCLERRDGDERAGVRWHQAVQHRQPGEGGDADLQQVHAAALADQHDHRHQQDDTHLEEQRQADQGGHAGHRPRERPGPDAPHDGVDDAVRAAGVRQQPADHGPQRDQQPDGAHGRPHARGEAVDGLGDPQTGDHTEGRGAEDEGQERVHLQPGDEHDDHGDGDHRRDDQLRVAGRLDGGGGEQMHPEASQSGPRRVTAEASSMGFACGAHPYAS